jgi:hypothetical protein
MKLKGYFRRDGHCYFDAFLVSDKLRKPEFLRLLLDTGTTTTTILDGDCERMGLDCTKLPRNKRDTMAVGAMVTSYLLRDGVFVFLDEHDGLQPEILGRIDVINPDEDSPKPDFSLMGMDLVSRFDKLVIDRRNRTVYLER